MEKMSGGLGLIMMIGGIAALLSVPFAGNYRLSVYIHIHAMWLVVQNGSYIINTSLCIACGSSLFLSSDRILLYMQPPISQNRTYILGDSLGFWYGNCISFN